MWLLLFVLFIQFIVFCFFIVVLVDFNLYKVVGGWCVVFLLFFSLELIVIIVWMFVILCIKNI